ncbi:GNAT family N-acetyltransferase [Mobilitalea sibirica]|uniref:GNAT family N-acetyltransferase n=1 Tax=Mobilitalea sibirica TaxID=1462919 RepID=A0A8J7HCW5_9FIRM|nr:GNAT family N-acetyltransferase [Mobilitalea sibirica]MBH1940264.1 GNAT family N-acetyltransferase [Mobilitalea sibirica]
MNGFFKMENEDLKEYAKLYVGVFNAPPWDDQWTIETAYKRLYDISNTSGFIGYKYVEDGEIKGSIMGNLEQWYEGFHYNLKEMFVATQLQGKGIGSKLLMELEKELKASDVNTVYLFTSKGDLTSHFYSNNGYEEIQSMVMMGKSI